MCVVNGCDSKSKVYFTIMFHRIPTKDNERKNQWLAALNIDLRTPVESIKKWRVCSEHFAPEDYLENMDRVTHTTVRRLKDTAIPTIFRAQTGRSGSSPTTVSRLATGHTETSCAIFEGDRTISHHLVSYVLIVFCFVLFFD